MNNDNNFNDIKLVSLKISNKYNFTKFNHYFSSKENCIRSPKSFMWLEMFFLRFIINRRKVDFVHLFVK